MMNKKILLVSCLIFMMFVGVGVVSAEDVNSTSLDIESTYDNQDFPDESLSYSDQEIMGEITSDDIDTVESGTVSGGVDIVAKHPWAPSDAKNGNHGDLDYTIPSKATDIKFAHVYVNIYSGTAQPSYGSIADISIKTDNGYLNSTESLWINSGTTNGVIYPVNDHINKCYSDYMIFYDITDLVRGLNGTSININVASLPMEGKSFDGRIKLISLILAYDDGDSDSIDYWVNVGQAWTDEKTYTHFNCDDVDIDSKTKITITNIGLSSNDAFYEINGDPLFFNEEEDEYFSGPYYQYHKWDITDYYAPDTELAFTASKDGWGSFKEVISVLIVNHNFSDDDDLDNATNIDFKTEYSNDIKPTICIFAGTTNTVTTKISTKNKGDYVVDLLADGVVVDEKKVSISKKVTTISLTDPTIRPVTANSVYGNKNDKVNYTVRILSNGKTINSSSHLIPVLYNGYLGKDLAYPCEEYELFFNEAITGDIVIDVKDESSYLERIDLKRTDVWNVNLPKDSNFVKAYVYVPYNYFIPNYLNKIPEDKNMFDVKFNGGVPLPVGFYRDQNNFQTETDDANYGYGLLVYDVTNLIKTGENTFVLNKKDEYPAVYPSTLIYMYNTTPSSKIKEVYISNGVDLLGNIYNLANRNVASNVGVDLNPDLVEDAKLYVFAAGAEKNEGDISFNTILNSNVWDGTLHTTDLYSLDIKDKIRHNNSISFISTNSTIQALQQIIVISKNIQTAVSNIDSEYGNLVFAGIENNINLNISNTRSGKFTVKLLADGVCVNSTEITLNGNSISLMLKDSTIRPVTKNSVYGKNNDKVNYTAVILSNGKIVDSSSYVLSVLYNGYLDKDLAYPQEEDALFFKGTITGDIVIDTKENYLPIPTLKRTDIWNVNLPKNSNFVKAFIYVPYYFFNPSLGVNEGKNMFSTLFNGAKVTPIGFYRDQSNYGADADYGYGLLVYDVSDLIKKGDNTFSLDKTKATTNVCPSTLIYLFNTTGSSVRKNVYISNGADLLSSDEISALKQVKSDSLINVDLNNVNDATLYVFATNAQKGEGNIIFNGKEFADVWSGKTLTSEVYSVNVKDKIKATNSISFVSTASTILSLQKILVTSMPKITTSISANNVNMFYLSGKQLILTLKDNKGNVLSKKHVSIKLNGNTFDRTTDSKGKVKLTISLAPKTYSASITFAGDGMYVGSTSKVNVVVKKATPKIVASKKTFKVKTKTKKYTITFKTNTGKPMKKVKVTLKVKGKTYKATTTAKGKATFKITKLTKKGKFTATIRYSGNKYYKAVSKSVKITVKK
ncbi:MAG: DUF3344 domain-containing protein [Methanobrevibacter sp.]|uniref:DUF3344 domain-containing protein n=1 Tax=Methanobrevibacter sp. TaxID=66852 RepID=UPI0025E4BF15|nr:DUF3344 domain-containing protein [Methanobrevibacter sp.]MBR3113684.1 DUF3344 domain-containing protein [Methanobrevibacter sp.]